MLHPPPPAAQPREAPQTRKRKRESIVAEGEQSSSEGKDTPEPAKGEEGTTAGSSKSSSEQPMPRSPDAPPDVMAVDGQSEEGQVEHLLNMTQLSVEDRRARSQTRDEIVDLANGELQYPGSEDPMDVDDSEVGEARKSATTESLAETVAVDDHRDAVAVGEPQESTGDQTASGAKDVQSASSEDAATAQAQPMEDSSKYPE